MSASAQRRHEAGDSSLSARDLAILEFERTWWHHAGAKEAAIRAEFSLSAARYYQVLNAVIDSPDAVRHDPMLVGRLQRARDARTRARAARAFTTPTSGDDPGRPRSEEPTD
ncbi:DUF3263 domain-containing protein [Galbitalea soli]|uniref:DUF3263 domain-containing protein n=1 Tax=Galbitalea soli TaxID=1268042 RepID=A0A7C9TRQ7_9MICO|nr:DUF3263 domain-containing protein [Galbitalea soli]NEM92377.1 DUF3263 domain-containing protein [Galbitalea soli]NYJ31666.1 hypothetical protein [Galbitalea soli]